MPKQPRLTEASEQRLSAALLKAADLASAGMDPNEALVKAATEASVPAGQVRLMVHAYNNGRSIGHYKAHDKLEEKAAAFPLADAGIVLERMFPSQPKTAAAQYDSAVVSAEYNQPPEMWTARRDKAAEQGLLKAAEVKMPEPYAPYEDKKRRRQLGEVHLRNKTANDKQAAAVQAGYAAVERVNALHNYFAQHPEVDPAAVADNAQMVYGQAIVPMLTKAAQDLPKRASKAATAPVDWSKEPYSLVTAAMEAVSTFKAARAEHEQASTEAAAKTAEVMRPFGRTGANDVIIGSVWDHHLRTKGAGIVDVGIGAMVADPLRNLAARMYPDEHEALVRKKVEDIASPAHDAKLRAIQIQTLLHNLIYSDPIIGSYPPETVMQSYNALSEMAPRAMGRYAMAQSMLRKHLAQGTMDPFDLDQLVHTEQRMTGDKARLPGEDVESGSQQPKA